MITIYQNFDTRSLKADRPIKTILNRIRDGKSREIVQRVREGEKDLKLQLPCILFSGQFTYRNSKSLIEHSGFICLDFDGFPDQEILHQWKESLENDKFTYCVFLSPSGNGLKCLVKIPKEPTNHKSYFDALKEYYNTEYFDSHCSDICRICFESYDPDLIINENSDTWTKLKEYHPVNVVYNISNLDEEKTAENLIKWWHKRFGNTPGSRNANLFKLMAAFNDYGVSNSYALSIAMRYQESDFTSTEIERIIKNAYRKTANFGTLKF